MKILSTSGPRHYAQLVHAQQHPDPERRRRQPLKRKNLVYDKPAQQQPRLRADPATGTIWYGEEQFAEGILPDAWRYRLGNRSAIEWVLDQYNPRRPKDPTIRAHFDTYRLADHLDEVFDLVERVTVVSVETMHTVDKLAAISPLNPSNADKPVHQRPAPATRQQAQQLLFDFGQPTSPPVPPDDIHLNLTNEEAEWYTLWWNTENQPGALTTLLERHGLSWPAYPEEWGVHSYWQGPKEMPGSFITKLILSPCQP